MKYFHAMTKKTRVFVVLGISGAALLGMLVFGSSTLHDPLSTHEHLITIQHDTVVYLGDDKKQFNVQLADTPEKMRKGLSGTSQLQEDEAMLFVAETPGLECFWMKDMYYSLDILWFDADKKLTHIERDITPESYPKNYCADQPASYVLEVRNGTAHQLGLEIGDTFDMLQSATDSTL